MMKDFNEFGKGAKDTMNSCMDYLVQELNISLKDGLFNVVVIDPTANKFIASVLLRIIKLKSKSEKNQVLEKDKFIILSAVADESDEWRMNFLKVFKEKIFLHDPAVYAEVILYDIANDYFKLLLVSENDDIVSELKTVMEFVERSTGLKSDVQLINGGLWTMQNDFVASHPFSPDDYDKTSPLEQWKSQHPLGLQVIAQLESKTPLSKDAVRHSLDKAIAFLHESSPVWGSQKTKIQQ
eukprot:2490917-Ditylum_brightwellii.AAC.1